MPIQEICVLSPTHIVDPGLSSLCIMFSCQNLVDHLRLDFIFSHLSFSVYPSFPLPISFSFQSEIGEHLIGTGLEPGGSIIFVVYPQAHDCSNVTPELLSLQNSAHGCKF